MMIDIVLINPSFEYAHLNEASAICPNLGIASIGSSLEKNFFKVRILDCPALEIGDKEIIKFIFNNNPKIIGFTCSTIQFNQVIRTSKKIKEVFPDKTIVIGGSHLVTMNYQDFPDCVDFICYSEGEVALLKISNFVIRNLGKKEEICGIIYKNKKKLVKNNFCEVDKNINKLPFPAYHILPMDKYRPYATFDLGKKFVSAITSRGCSFSCIFCASAREFSGGWRGLNYKNMFVMVEMLYNKHSIRHIYFQDDEFTMNKNRIIKFCDLLIKKRIKISWECLSRASDITEPLIRIMKKAGCQGILLGVEVGYQEGLERINKKEHIKNIKNAFKILRKYGVESRATFIMGFPWETERELDKTINFALEINPDIAYFQLLVPYEKTILYNELKNKGLLKEQDYNQFVQHSIVGSEPLIRTYHLSSEVLKRYVKKAFIKFYARPSYWIRRIKQTKNLHMIKRYVKVGFELLSSLFLRKN